MPKLRRTVYSSVAYRSLVQIDRLSGIPSTEELVIFTQDDRIQPSLNCYEHRVCWRI
jgi:hypothetical protein